MYALKLCKALGEGKMQFQITVIKNTALSQEKFLKKGGKFFVDFVKISS